jgi:putative hydrolase of the HAD superfamily
MKRIEIEQKFFCSDMDALIKELNFNNLKMITKENEIDEYFTDIDSVFVENRTCLRIRTTNNEKMEVTFKGKSKEISNLYLKSESNITINIDEYSDVVTMFNALGYYSYTKVVKERMTYTSIDHGVTYNVMVDNINELGSFVEFEILSNEDKDKQVLFEMLNNFVDKFSALNLEPADMPYRDFVAKAIYESILPKKEIKAILFDLDGTLIESETVFFESFKDVLLEYGVEIDYDMYKLYEQKKNAKLIDTLKEENKINEDITPEEIMKKVYDKYEEKFRKVITKPTSVLNFELIKKIKEKNIKVGLVTTSRRFFIDILINELNISDLFDLIIAREDVENLKPAPDAYDKALKALNIDKDNCIVIEDALRGIQSAIALDLKTINVGEELFSNDLVVNIDLVSRVLFVLLNWL